MDSLLNDIGSLLRDHDCEAYLVGGFVRDWLLNRYTADIDIAVACDAMTIAREMAGRLDATFVPLDEENVVARVIVETVGQHWQVDFSSFRGGIESDLKRRDFTIDAMAIGITEWGKPGLTVVDPTGGREDLVNRDIRVVDDSVFDADPVRLLRAVRLAAELEFGIEKGTENLLVRRAGLITSVPGERIRGELLRLLALREAGDIVHLLDRLHLLTGIVPELADGKGLEQHGEHFWDVLGHSLETVSAAGYLIREGKWAFGSERILEEMPWSESISQHFTEEVSKDSDRRIMLKLAGLLHDIAKPKTHSVDENGRTRFLGHNKEGAEMTESILERLRFSTREKDLVKTLVYFHLRPVQMTSDDLPTDRAIYRYFRDTGDASIDIVFLASADYLATRGPTLDWEDWQKHCRLIKYILNACIRHKETPPARLISGHDLMETFGLSPGKEIGKVLELVREAQALGEIRSKEQALAFAERILRPNSEKVL